MADLNGKLTKLAEDMYFGQPALPSTALDSETMNAIRDVIKMKQDEIEDEEGVENVLLALGGGGIGGILGHLAGKASSSTKALEQLAKLRKMKMIGGGLAIPAIAAAAYIASKKGPPEPTRR